MSILTYVLAYTEAQEIMISSDYALVHLLIINYYFKASIYTAMQGEKIL